MTDRQQDRVNHGLVTVTPFAIALGAYVLAIAGVIGYDVAIATIALMAVFKD